MPGAVSAGAAVPSPAPGQRHSEQHVRMGTGMEIGTRMGIGMGTGMEELKLEDKEKRAFPKNYCSFPTPFDYHIQ